MYIVYVSSGDISFLHIWSLLVLFVYLKRAGDKGDSFETDHAALVMTPRLNRYSCAIHVCSDAGDSLRVREPASQVFPEADELPKCNVMPLEGLLGGEGQCAFL